MNYQIRSLGEGRFCAQARRLAVTVLLWVPRPKNLVPSLVRQRGCLPVWGRLQTGEGLLRAHRRSHGPWCTRLELRQRRSLPELPIEQKEEFKWT